MTTFFEAVFDKYGLPSYIRRASSTDDQNDSTIKKPRLIPTIMVLTSQNITCTGTDTIGYENICEFVKRLDISSNYISDWNEIYKIIKRMPDIEFLNASWNTFNIVPSRPLPNLTPFEELTTLMLNKTKIDWKSVGEMFQFMPNLFELQLCSNEYTYVGIDIIVPDAQEIQHTIKEEPNSTDGKIEEKSENPNAQLNSNQRKAVNNGNQKKLIFTRIKPHKALRILHLTSNRIKEWVDVCRLGRVFPKLNSLILMNCPLRGIRMPSSDYPEGLSHEEYNYILQTHHLYFKHLRTLNLNNTAFSRWEDVALLVDFPNIRTLWTLYWPLWDKFKMTEELRRQLLIARLPGVVNLNGSRRITVAERENAELAFLEYYKKRRPVERPDVYKLLATIYEPVSFGGKFKSQMINSYL